jgi:hypothetical protein
MYLLGILFNSTQKLKLVQYSDNFSQNQSNNPPIPPSSSSSLGSSFFGSSFLTGTLVAAFVSGTETAGCELATKLSSGILYLKLI